MRVAEYLERSGMSAEDLAAAVGVTPEGVRNRRNRPMPAAWLERLDAGPAASPDDVIDLGEERERRADQPPRRPSDGKAASPPLDYNQLAGYIEGAYKLGAHTISSQDAVLAGAIAAHAQQAGEAWAKWVESEPRVAELLQRLMVGTPLGEVIGVHVAIAFAYFLARGATASAVRAAAAAAEPAEPAAEDQLASAQG